MNKPLMSLFVFPVKAQIMLVIILKIKFIAYLHFMQFINLIYNTANFYFTYTQLCEVGQAEKERVTCLKTLNWLSYLRKA